MSTAISAEELLAGSSLTRDITLATRIPAGMLQGALMLWRMNKSKKSGRPILSYGGSLQGRMLMLAHEKGVPIRTETGVVELVEEDGRVTGVVVERPKPSRSARTSVDTSGPRPSS